MAKCRSYACQGLTGPAIVGGWHKVKKLVSQNKAKNMTTSDLHAKKKTQIIFLNQLNVKNHFVVLKDNWKNSYKEI